MERKKCIGLRLCTVRRLGSKTCYDTIDSAENRPGYIGYQENTCSERVTQWVRYLPTDSSCRHCRVYLESLSRIFPIGFATEWYTRTVYFDGTENKQKRVLLYAFKYHQLLLQIQYIMYIITPSL